MAKEPGLSLADLAAMSEDVPIGTSYITVHGLSASDCLSIFKRFPKLAKMLSGFDATTFIEVAPDAVAAIIAASVNKGANLDEAAEEAAGQISVEVQYDILEAIGRLTFKNGFAPFVQRIMRLASAADSASFTKVPDMKSPQVSNPSSPPVTPQT